MSIPLKIVQLTPLGRGAIATLLIEGDGALAAVEANFQTKNGRPLSKLLHYEKQTTFPTESESSGTFHNNRLVFGHFGAPPGAEAVVRCRSPESVEIHCLGGLASVAMIQEALSRCGGQTSSWQEWLAAGADDPIAAEAAAALAQATTPRTAAILLDQYRGALGRELTTIERAVQTGDITAAKSRLDALLAFADLGLHLVQPWRVVMAGRPNVGKSSLINALLGYDRAIVHASPGTTRDVVTATTALDGWPVELSDTAGLRSGGGDIERAGIELARKKMAAADLVILAFDLGSPWSKDDEDLVGSWPKALVVHTKSDLVVEEKRTGEATASIEIIQSRAAGIATSSLTGEGIEELVQSIAHRLVPNPPPPGAAVPFTREQIERLLENVFSHGSQVGGTFFNA
jgi:tRNA modification GTPase